MATCFASLTDDVMRAILWRLRGPAVAQLGATCKAMHDLAQDPELWRSLCFRDFPMLVAAQNCMGASVAPNIDFKSVYHQHDMLSQEQVVFPRNWRNVDVPKQLVLHFELLSDNKRVCTLTDRVLIEAEYDEIGNDHYAHFFTDSSLWSGSEGFEQSWVDIHKRFTDALAPHHDLITQSYPAWPEAWRRVHRECGLDLFRLNMYVIDDSLRMALLHRGKHCDFEQGSDDDDDDDDDDVFRFGASFLVADHSVWSRRQSGDPLPRLEGAQSCFDSFVEGIMVWEDGRIRCSFGSRGLAEPSRPPQTAADWMRYIVARCPAA